MLDFFYDKHSETRNLADDLNRIRKCSDVLSTYKTQKGPEGAMVTVTNTCSFEHKDLSRVKAHISSEHNWELKKCKLKLLNGEICGEYRRSVLTLWIKYVIW